MVDTPNPTLPWYQHSLQWPLLLALALPTLWFGVKMQQAGKQKTVIEGIENLGGLVWYDYQFDGGDIPHTEDAQPPGPPWLRRLIGDDFFRTVTKLDLTQTEIPDAGLKKLEGLTDLQSLSLGEGVTDAGLVHLQGFIQLQTLDLTKTRCTAAGLLELQEALPNCKIHR
ncbi:MAG: hypothetical protein ABSF26_01995 [Thermoguttaceae bacterium]|jgi:hypothetical protein